MRRLLPLLFVPFVTLPSLAAPPAMGPERYFELRGGGSDRGGALGMATRFPFYQEPAFVEIVLDGVNQDQRTRLKFGIDRLTIWDARLIEPENQTLRLTMTPVEVDMFDDVDAEGKEQSRGVVSLFGFGYEAIASKNGLMIGQSLEVGPAIAGARFGDKGSTGFGARVRARAKLGYQLTPVDEILVTVDLDAAVTTLNDVVSGEGAVDLQYRRRLGAAKVYGGLKLRGLEYDHDGDGPIEARNATFNGAVVGVAY
jgi:hypothetical protein